MVRVERLRLISTPRNQLGWPKVTQLEVPLQLCLYVLDALLRLANDMAVIHIGWHNHLSASAVLP